MFELTAGKSNTLGSHKEFPKVLLIRQLGSESKRDDIVGVFDLRSILPENAINYSINPLMDESSSVRSRAAKLLEKQPRLSA